MTYAKIKKLCLPLICVVLLVASGCASGGSDSAQNSKPAFRTEDIDDRLLEANRRFAFELYDAVLRGEDDDNVFISPLSVAMALSMTYNGAEAETQKAMAKALQVKDLSIEEVNQSNAALKDVIEHADPDVELNIANSLWGREGTPFKDDFLAQNEQFYDAHITALDFDDPKAAKTINKWVHEQTNGKIEEIVDANIHPLTILFLINAIYFKGEWQTPFDEALTREEDFHLMDGSAKSVPMMSQSGDFAYLEGPDFQAVQLPYGNERLGMTVFLPDRNTSLDEFQQQLNADNWQAWMDQFETVEGSVMLPRFELEYETQLNDALKDLGMGVAFQESRANFSRMVDIPPNAFIKEVKHKSFIEVNEEGTEAAAATSVEVRLESAPLDSFNMRVDRPFFFVIQDYETGVLLFMGSVTSP